MIYHTKESTIEFNVDVSGVNDTDMLVRFIIETADMDISFNCKSTNKKDWMCKIPPMKFLEKTTYTYRIEVCTDGYFLKGATGSITISATAELYHTEPKNVTIAPKGSSEITSSKKPDEEKSKSPIEITIEKPTKQKALDKVSKQKEMKKEQEENVLPLSNIINEQQPTELSKTIEKILSESKKSDEIDTTTKTFKFSKNDSDVIPTKQSQQNEEISKAAAIDNVVKKILEGEREVPRVINTKGIKITKSDSSNN